MDLIEKNKYNRKYFRHPWEISRAQIILEFVKGLPRHTTYADIGAGDQFFTKKLNKYTKRQILALDTKYKNLHKDQAISEFNDIDKIDFKKVDCCILMDVLEHIKNDNVFLTNLTTRTKDGTKFIITVPANNFLYSYHDKNLKHYRRYDKKKIKNIINHSHLEIEEMHYFFTGPFVLRLIGVFLDKIYLLKLKKSKIAYWKFKEDHVFTQIITRILLADYKINRFLNRIKLNMPGLSLLVICKKTIQTP